MLFQIHLNYTRQQIHDQLGGDLQSYLPHVDGQVVCGCFDPALNARAPFEIDLGTGRDIERYADRLYTQRTSVPVFLKRGTFEWEYVGDFVATDLSNNEDDLFPAKAFRRQDARSVLYLEEHSAQSDTPQPDSTLVGDSPQAIEGAKSLAKHLRRERSPVLVEAKRRAFRNEHGSLSCQACSLAESNLPKGLGEACFEVHHLEALAGRHNASATRLDDLAIVCANCHRMIHRTQPMLSIEHLSHIRANDV